MLSGSKTPTESIALRVYVEKHPTCVDSLNCKHSTANGTRSLGPDCHCLHRKPQNVGRSPERLIRRERIAYELLDWVDCIRAISHSRGPLLIYVDQLVASSESFAAWVVYRWLLAKL